MTPSFITSEPLLQVKQLQITFDNPTAPNHPFRAVNHVSFSLKKEETLCLVGESGCGKSVTAKAIMHLLPIPPATYAGGNITFDGQNILSLNETALQKIRGNDIGMVFQEPMTSLNPVLRIGDQVTEPLLLHKNLTKQQARDKALAMLAAVGLPHPEKHFKQYPHELSGGMRQRVMIAQALICSPKLLIADEPTTALDTTVQQQILHLLKKLMREHATALLLITHDFGVVAQMADYVAVMYAGKLVEKARATTLLKNPQHPYTQGLLNSRPSVFSQQEICMQPTAQAITNAQAITQSQATGEIQPTTSPHTKTHRKRLPTISGTVPSLADLPNGCLFHPRCNKALPQCMHESPPFFSTGSGDCEHEVACWLMQ